MVVDPALRKQLMDARDRILVQIHELVSVAKFSYEEGPPDLRDVYAELQNQLREIDHLLEANG